MKDKYDDAVERLTEHPEEILEVWSDPHLFPDGCLFQFVNPSGKRDPWGGVGQECGCLTLIRQSPEKWKACTPELTARVLGDKRIPKNPQNIKPHHLPVFARWQRRLDKELKRT
jgi:hypothetical protein